MRMLLALSVLLSAALALDLAPLAWAKDQQVSHEEGMDWYACSSAHSQPLNANRRAYAAWWLWARLAGWDGDR